MRIAYISGEKQVPKIKKQSKKDAFMEEVMQAIESRSRLDEQRAEELFKPEQEELDKLKQTLNELKKIRDEVL